MSTQSKTDFSRSTFIASAKQYAIDGEAAIHEMTLGDFLREYIEDPAAAWIKRETEDGRFEVRTNFHNRLRPGHLHGTFDTREEAEQFILEGLYWDFNNKDFNGPSYDFSREELVAFLNEYTAEQ